MGPVEDRGDGVSSSRRDESPRRQRTQEGSRPSRVGWVGGGTSPQGLHGVGGEMLARYRELGRWRQWPSRNCTLHVQRPRGEAHAHFRNPTETDLPVGITETLERSEERDEVLQKSKGLSCRRGIKTWCEAVGGSAAVASGRDVDWNPCLAIFQLCILSRGHSPCPYL